MVNRFMLEDDLEAGKVESITFENGEVKKPFKYRPESHRIVFEDGEICDLLVAHGSIVSYKLKTIKKTGVSSLPKKVIKTPAKKKLKKSVKTTKKTFSIYRLAKGKPGKTFSIKRFLDIYKQLPKRKLKKPKHEIQMPNDKYVYGADSQQEISVVKKLISHKCFKRLRGQCMDIEYKFNGKKHSYTPDILLLSNTNKIIVIEVKEVAEMSTKQNKAKYRALSRECLKNGYLYMMIDKNFVSYEKIQTQKGSNRVNEAIDYALDESGSFDYYDYLDLIDGKTHNEIKKIRKNIGVYVASHKNVKMLGNLTHDIYNFRIKNKKFI